MQRVKTASVVAKYTTKPGPTEVWNAKELKFLIDIENLHLIDRFLDGFKVDDENAVLDIIREVGIGGSFLTNGHTLDNYAKNLYIPEIMDSDPALNP